MVLLLRETFYKIKAIRSDYMQLGNPPSIFTETAVLPKVDCVKEQILVSPTLVTTPISFSLQEAGYFKVDDRYFTGRENLNSFFIALTLSGRAELLYEQQKFTLSKGDCIFINCMNYHYYKTMENETWEYLWIHFNGNHALDFYNEFTKNGFHLTHFEDCYLIETMIHRIISVNQKIDLTTGIVSANLINNILSELLIRSLYTDQNKQSRPSFIDTIIQEIQMNFKDKITIEDLATTLHLDKYHVMKEFKKHTGTTIYEYIINMRISHAKELLKYSDLSISDITYECGMNTTSHFINLFKTREQMTPLAYRKQWQT